MRRKRTWSSSQRLNRVVAIRVRRPVPAPVGTSYDFGTFASPTALSWNFGTITSPTAANLDLGTFGGVPV